MIFNYDPNTLTQAVDDIPPIGLNTYQLIYLEISMLIAISLPYLTLHIFQSAIVALLAYVIIALLLLPYLYIVYFAQGKRVIDYYMTGEFIFKKENNFILGLSSLIIFISLFTISTFFLSQENVNSIKLYFDQTKQFEIAMFGCLFIFGLGTLEEYYWRNFLIKSLPTGWLAALYPGVHYGILYLFALSTLFEWQFLILICLLSIIWHMSMVYLRKLLKFSSVIIYGIVGRLGMFMSFYILFQDFKQN